MSTEESVENKALSVETHGIDHIDEHRRHGRPLDQFTIRFSPVIYLAPIVLGGAGIPLGLGLTGSVTAILLGNVLGALCTSLCAVMGPRLGMPQLTMGRSAFGYRGNYVPAALTSLLCLGYFTVGTILGAKSLASLTHLPYVPLAVVVAAASVLIAVFGHNLLHVFGRWVTWFSLILLAVVTVFVLKAGAGPGAAGSLSGGGYRLAWLVEFTVVFSYTMSWAPYASDYSRYLPATTRFRAVFGWSFLGLFLGTTWMMVVGALVLTLLPDGEALDAFRVALPGPLLTITLFTFGVAALPHNAVNLYSNAMTSLTWNFPVRRTGTVLIAGALGCVLSVLLGGPNFVNAFEAFLFLLTYFVMPWLAIICVDFYGKHGGGRWYASTDAFYRATGPLGGVRWAGLGSFLVGIVVSVPFMATNLYTGPIGHALGGADLSYFVSFVVGGLLYALTSRPDPAEDETVPAVISR
jgi:nucleobase:cation symporter-1, NCS1 family